MKLSVLTSLLPVTAVLGGVTVSATDSGSPTSVTFNSTPIATTTSSTGNVPESATTIVTTSNAQHSSQTVTLSSPQTLTTFMATVYPTSSGQYITVYPSGIIGNTTTIPICGGPPLDVGGTSTVTVPTSSSSSNSSQATGTNLQANDAGDDSTASSAGRLGFSPEGMALGAAVVLGMAVL
ncbi:hypothetical protein M413DRAFT_7553 [Hebeloma cylindrosporum]|uniref:GPI anchored protein n=1 Tax=Hebeloma cylindrosporum TaxID=76867 RepID=A0A0C3CRY0_HEBCY|nr:hypothetical protein M413DRAFT_7553 [Hebeloma cylindrosporum h7]